MFTKMKINPNIQILLKDFRHNVKQIDIASIFKKKFNLFNEGITYQRVI